ncbi:hypothetical protein [Ectothiorhodospira variabilis]|uniref:hypothetical protein n=1 Tax=Ectothiorhodospira variabilis TaxID=505694 RepID=UPI001EFA4FE3|nr:hypothetical protein [Ectothiorhodospira variabilis]MCG5495687.1 hypothetical protein [Ectothiorhodospira variabilis]MCG5504583.1 hypothetical protein [Ectothiorhodospira variabilis]MCG5507709.1 hypothetical protein [Ectothiorhodospira variabilis]
MNKATRTTKATHRNELLADEHALEILEQLIADDHFVDLYIAGLVRQNNVKQDGMMKVHSILEFLKRKKITTRRGKDYSESTFMRLKERLIRLKGIDICSPLDLQECRNRYREKKDG